MMLDDRFWTKVDKTGANGCWEWTASKNNKGYGFFRPGGLAPKRSAHRLSYENAHGAIPKEAYILHSCDNPACVNPAHLRAGTAKENVTDMDARGRRNSPHLCGAKNPFAKLTDDDVVAIRRAYIQREPVADICERFSVPSSSINDYTSGRSWRHLFERSDCPSLAELKAECARRTRNNATMAPDVVREIRRRLQSGEAGKDLASEYGVHKATISDIKLRKIWADI